MFPHCSFTRGVLKKYSLSLSTNCFKIDKYDSLQFLQQVIFANSVLTYENMLSAKCKTARHPICCRETNDHGKKAKISQNLDREQKLPKFGGNLGNA